MRLTDPCEALADQAAFISYLLGLTGLAGVVHTLAADGAHRSASPRHPDDFVHALLGLASIGAAIERLSNTAVAQPRPAGAAMVPSTPRWLR